MATLTGQTIASSYEQLLSLPDGGGDETTLVAITDGDGVNTFAIKVSTRHIEVIPDANSTTTFDVSQADGTSILSVDTTNSKVIATELDISGNVDIDGTLNVDTIDIDGAFQLDSTLTVGTDGSGQDVTFYSSTAGDSFVWDASEEKLTITGTNGQTALDIADGNLVVADNVDIEGDIDINGTTNLDAVDIDGNVQLDGTFTVGVNDTGYDVKFFGDTATNGYMLWDASTDDLILGSSSKLGIGVASPDGTVHIQTADGSGYDASAEADELVIENNGNAGLTITGPNASSQNIYFGSASTDVHAKIETGFDADLMTIGTTNANADLRFIVGNGSEAIRILDSGNVGIGTDSPNEGKLVVQDSTKAELVIKTSATATDTEAALMFKISTDTVDQRKKGGIIYKDVGDNGIGDMFFVLDSATDNGSATVAGNAVMTLKNNGNVGIGDADPSEAKLSIDNVASGDAGLKINQTQNEYALEIVTSATSSHGLNINASSLQASGRAGTFYSNSADDGTRDLVAIINDDSSATGTTALKIQQDSTGLALDVDGKVAITTANNEDTLTLISTDADNNAGAYLNIYRNSASPADNDQIGQITFSGRNDNSEDIDYARIITQIRDASDGSELGRFAINTMIAGGIYSRINVMPTETVFNDESVDLDFRIESNSNANMFVVDGGIDRVGIGSTPSTHQLEVHGADWDTSLLVKASGANSGMTFMDSAGNKDAQFLAGSMSLKVLINTTSRMKIDDNSRISLSNNDSNVGSTVFGYNALDGNTDNESDRNTAIGYGALDGIGSTTAVDNIAIGYDAIGGSMTATNSDNVAIGNYSMDAGMTNSSSNVAVGSQAFSSATAITSCVAIGKGAFANVASIVRGVAIGEGALGGAEASDHSVGIGYSSMYNTTGAKNTALGYQSANTVTSGTENTVVGYDADASASGAVNQTVVGSETTGQADNSVTLGNASVTDVYMGQDSGAVVHSGALVNGLSAVLVTTSTLAYDTHQIVRGKYVTVSADAQTITLPAVQVGAIFIIVNIATDGGALLTISPNSGDKFLTNIAGASGTDDKDITNTKATQNQGDFVKLVGMSADGWAITEISGIWADES